MQIVASKVLMNVIRGFVGLLLFTSVQVMGADQTDTLQKRFPNVCSSFQPSPYECLLLTQLRDQNTQTQAFRSAAQFICEILVSKVVTCLDTKSIEIQTPVAPCCGHMLQKPLEFVSILRSGDALLDVFMIHFPGAPVNKILIQRNEESAKPMFVYKKMTPSLTSGTTVVILDPMVATGGTLKMAISLLKTQGVHEENIIVACIVAAPEGLAELYNAFPKVKVVMNVLDEKLNEKKYIVPGLGDFGDRFFGTPKVN